MNLTITKFILVIACPLFMASSGYAQDFSASMDALNQALGISYTVSNKKKILIIDGFREGEHVKTDKVNIFDLDMETLRYSKIDESVSIKCYSDIDGCVTSTLTRERNEKSYRNRIVFGLTENASGEEVLTKLRQLLNQMTETY